MDTSNTSFHLKSNAFKMNTMKRRVSSPTDIEAARRLRREWDSRKKQLGLTQEKAAKALECTQQNIQQYLSGTIPLGMEMTIKFAILLKIKPYEIRPEMKNTMDRLGPIMAQSDNEPIELSQDELEWVQLLRQLSPEEQRVMRRAVAALAQSKVDPVGGEAAA